MERPELLTKRAPCAGVACRDDRQAVCTVLSEQHRVFVHCLRDIRARVDMRVLWTSVGLKVGPALVMDGAATHTQGPSVRRDVGSGVKGDDCRQRGSLLETADDVVDAFRARRLLWWVWWTSSCIGAIHTGVKWPWPSTPCVPVYRRLSSPGNAATNAGSPVIRGPHQADQGERDRSLHPGERRQPPPGEDEEHIAVP